ncbi:Uncharacterised protein [Enterobacter hormaechei]|uniref:Secreted protein n=1 Tax=Enterobacter hormaechei TaxID=158836 RepID=A0ABD7L5T1_9ENTR|nr:Uncharacterised protein [Enterobacter hormaechei]
MRPFFPHCSVTLITILLLNSGTRCLSLPDLLRVKLGVKLDVSNVFLILAIQPGSFAGFTLDGTELICSLCALPFSLGLLTQCVGIVPGFSCQLPGQQNLFLRGCVTERLLRIKHGLRSGQITNTASRQLGLVPQFIQLLINRFLSFGVLLSFFLCRRLSALRFRTTCSGSGFYFDRFSGCGCFLNRIPTGARGLLPRFSCKLRGFLLVLFLPVTKAKPTPCSRSLGVHFGFRAQICYLLTGGSGLPSKPANGNSKRIDNQNHPVACPCSLVNIINHGQERVGESGIRLGKSAREFLEFCVH